MKHDKVTFKTELKSGDSVLVDGKWAEIYNVTMDDGIFTSRGNVCRTKLEAESNALPAPRGGSFLSQEMDRWKRGEIECGSEDMAIHVRQIVADEKKGLC